MASARTASKGTSASVRILCVRVHQPSQRFIRVFCLFDHIPVDDVVDGQILKKDRDGSYGEKFSEAAIWLGIREVLTAPQSPWQDAYVEGLVGSIRRECLDHVIVLNESGLRRILKSYFEYYERSRTHLSLTKDAPIARSIQPIGTGAIVAIPQVGGLHRYARVAA